MPASAQFTIERSVATGHAVDALQVINFSLLLQGKDRGRGVDRDVQYSIGNSVFINRHESWTTWRCKSVPVTGITLEYFREFLDSVETQEFQFDPVNAVPTDPDAIGVVLSRAGYREKREIMRGDTETGDYFSFTWDMRQVSSGT